MSLVITLGLVLVYLGLLYLLGPFFGQPRARWGRRSVLSIVAVIVFSLLIFVISFSIPNLWLSNRIVHIFGGGFIGVVVCFLAGRDSQIKISRFQFFLFSFLFVTTLGVANEIMEFFLQHYFSQYDLIFATTVNDTWLDLVSNTIGILLAVAIFVPLIKKKTD